MTSHPRATGRGSARRAAGLGRTSSLIVCLSIVSGLASADDVEGSVEVVSVDVASECLPEGWTVAAVETQLDAELALIPMRRDPSRAATHRLRGRCDAPDDFVLEHVCPAGAACGEPQQIELDGVPASLRMRALAMIAAELLRDDTTDLGWAEAPAAPELEAEPAVVESMPIAVSEPPPRRPVVVDPDERAEGLATPHGPHLPPVVVQLGVSATMGVLAGPAAIGGGALELRIASTEELLTAIVVIPRLVTSEAAHALGRVTLVAADVTLGVVLGGRIGPLDLGGAVGFALGWASLRGQAAASDIRAHASEDLELLLPVWLDAHVDLGGWWIGARAGMDVGLMTLDARAEGRSVLSRGPIGLSASVSLGFEIAP